MLTNGEAQAGRTPGFGSVAGNARNEHVEGQRIRLADGPTVGFADYGTPAAAAVLWCHGGPGSRVERLT